MKIILLKRRETSSEKVSKTGFESWTLTLGVNALPLNYLDNNMNDPDSKLFGHFSLCWFIKKSEIIFNYKKYECEIFYKISTIYIYMYYNIKLYKMTLWENECK